MRRVDMWCVLGGVGVCICAGRARAAFVIDDVSFFSGIPHSLIDWETDGAGSEVLIAEGRERSMFDDEYVSQGIRFSDDTSVIWQNPSLNAINGAQFIGGSPFNFLGLSLFGEDVATEFVIEFLQPVRAVGFWMELGKLLPPPEFAAFDADGNILGSVSFSGNIVDGAFDDFINYGFMGIASETPIDRLVLTNGLDNGFFLDDLRFSAVPAPGGAVVMGVGASALFRRRRRAGRHTRLGGRAL